MRADHLMPEHDAVRKNLEAMSGDAFDRAYVDEMVKHHQMDLADSPPASAGCTATAAVDKR